jgi:uncharacterized protein (TIGR02466 family)
MILDKGIYPSSVDKSLWESPIWIQKTGFNASFNRELLTELYHIADRVRHNRDPAVGSSLLDYVDANPRLTELLQFKQSLVTETINQYLPATQSAEMDPISSWLNVKETGEQIEMHSHPDSTVASTYYITVPTDGGKLYYLDTGRVGQHCTSIKYIQPSEGDLIFFPSYVLHGVSANQDSALRVSLSTDFKYRLTPESHDQLVLTSWVDSMIKIKQLI